VRAGCSNSVSDSVGSGTEGRRRCARYSPLVGVGDDDEVGEEVDEVDKMVAVLGGIGAGGCVRRKNREAAKAALAHTTSAYSQDGCKTRRSGKAMGR
jgi:hypothetical protein